MNSKTLFFFFGSIGVERRGSYFEYLSQYLKQLPIRSINFSDPSDKQKHDAVVELVETMLSLHEQAATVDPPERARLEREIAADAQIDAPVYGLYELTEEEIRIVEGAK